MIAICAIVGLFVLAKANPPPKLNLDPDASTSGLSSGAFMAVQYATVFSSSVMGVGVFAGGPFYCTEGTWAKVPRCGVSPVLGLSGAKNELADVVSKFATQGKIDPVAGVQRQKVYLFSGKLDFTIRQGVMEVTEDVYRRIGVPKANIKTKFDLWAAHAWPTDNYGSLCKVAGPPYLTNCDYDGSGAMLNHFYPGLKPRVTPNNGLMIKFDQRPFIPGGKSASDAQIDDEGFMFIPPACSNGARCRVHIAFHGCTQGHSFVGKRFIENAGLNHWAQANDIVVVYPQARAFATNPIGCWDYVGSTNGNFATKDGLQVGMVRNVIKFISGDAPSNPVNPPVDPPVDPPVNPVDPPVLNTPAPPIGRQVLCNPPCGVQFACNQGTCVFAGDPANPQDPGQPPLCQPSCSVGQVCTPEGTCVIRENDAPMVIDDDNVGSGSAMVMSLTLVVLAVFL